MIVYLLRCQQGNRRYWRAIITSPPVSEETRLTEIADKAGVNKDHVVALTEHISLEIAAFWGHAWEKGRP